VEDEGGGRLSRPTSTTARAGECCVSDRGARDLSDGVICMGVPATTVPSPANKSWWLPPHPAECLGSRARAVLLLASVVMLVELTVAFGSLQRGFSGASVPSLEKMARLRSRTEVTAMRTGLEATPGAVAAFERALLVDMIYPFVYCGLGILLAACVGSSDRWHLGRVGAWLLTTTFAFDHLENTFLWREISGPIRSWEPSAAWTFHGLKWLTLFIGVAAVIASVALFVLARLRRSPTRTEGANRE
jgi:hypothetical protein